MCTWNTCYHVTEASFLIFSLTGMIYLVLSLGTSFEEAPESERILLVILCVCTSMMTVVAISKIYRRWKYDVSRVELELLSPGATPRPLRTRNIFEGYVLNFGRNRRNTPR